MRRFSSASSSVVCARLMDGPVVHPKISDVLFNDWNDPTFDAYRDIEDRWVAEHGFVRYADLSKGKLNRIYAQFAVQYLRNEPKWVPFIIDTGAPATFMSRHSMRRLGVPVDDTSRFVSNSATFSCGGIKFSAAVSDEGRSASLDSLDAVNIMGMTELKQHVHPMWQSLVRAIGSPHLPKSVWVKCGRSTFEVAPLKNNVDSLKKAVKAKMPTTITKDAPLLTVKDKDGKVLKASSPLTANTKETAYVVK